MEFFNLAGQLAQKGAKAGDDTPRPRPVSPAAAPAAPKVAEAQYGVQPGKADGGARRRSRRATEGRAARAPLEHREDARPAEEEVSARARGRFAPSPTGRLHLGNARTRAARAGCRRARAGGEFLLRIEDLDRAALPAGARGRRCSRDLE